MQKATNAYQKENDKFGQFVDECLEVGNVAEECTSHIYAEYQSWCYANGYHTEKAKNFKAELNNIGTIVRKRPKGGGDKTTLLLGCKLLKRNDFLD